VKKTSRFRPLVKDFYLKLKDYLLFLKRTSFFWALIFIVVLTIIGSFKTNFFYAAGQLERMGELGELSFEPTEVNITDNSPTQVSLWMKTPRIGKIFSFKIQAQGAEIEFTKNSKLASYISEDQSRIVIDLINLPKEEERVLLGYINILASESKTNKITIPPQSLFLDENRAERNINLHSAFVNVKKDTSLDQASQDRISANVKSEEISLGIPRGLLFFLASADSFDSNSYKIKLDARFVLALTFLFLILLIYLSVKIERRLFSNRLPGNFPIKRSSFPKKSFGYQVASRFVDIEILERNKENNAWRFSILLKSHLPIVLPEPYLRIPLPTGWQIDEESVLVDGACFQNYKEENVFYLALGTLYPEEKHKISFRLVPSRI